MKEQTEVELIAWHPTGFRLTFIVQANQSVLVGKSSNCDVQLRGHDISDIHCSIGFEHGQLWIQDWMSASGTKVNGTPISSQTYVGQGCVIEIGSYKIQISTAKETSRESTAVDNAKRHAASTPVDEQAKVELTSRATPQPLAVTTEHVAADSELSSDDSPAIDQIPPTEFVGHVAPALDNANHARPKQPLADSDLLTQEDETYDRETVELLLAEIDDLRAALAQADAQHVSSPGSPADDVDESENSDQVLSRIRELSEEANRAEERVLLLEEMLHAAEDTNRAEVEERSHLEAWVGDIEKRVGQREAEHAAELEALRERLDSADKANIRLQRQLQHRAADGECTDDPHDDVLEQLQRENGELQNTLADVAKELRQLKQKFENQSEESDTALREERAKIAREHAEMSRLKYEYAQKIKELEELPTTPAHTDPSRQSVLEHRQYLREMNQGKKMRSTSPSLTSRLKSLWNSID